MLLFLSLLHVFSKRSFQNCIMLWCLASLQILIMNRELYAAMCPKLQSTHYAKCVSIKKLLGASIEDFTFKSISLAFQSMHNPVFAELQNKKSSRTLNDQITLLFFTRLCFHPLTHLQCSHNLLILSCSCSLSLLLRS